jgi:hypothetical protein
MPVLPVIQSAPSFDGMAVWDSSDFASLGSNSQDTGVRWGMTVTQNTGSDMAVATAAGTVKINGYKIFVAAQTGIAVGAASTTDRRDLVVARGGVGIVVIAGTPCSVAGWNQSNTSAAPPVKPAIVAATDCILAELYISGSGTGGTNTTFITTATNVVDKRNLLVPNFRPAIYVDSLGADSSGTFDSSSAINTAINQLPASGGDIVFNGYYMINSPLYIGNGTQMSGKITAFSTSTIATFVSTAGTITTAAPGGNFTPPTGGGTFGVYTASLTMVIFTYTAYNASTHVYSGVRAATGSTGTLTTSMYVTAGTASSTSGIRLVGTGQPGVPLAGFIGLGQLGSAIFAGSSFPGFSNMILFQGPVEGCGIENLVLNGYSQAYNVLALQAASFGVFKNNMIYGGQNGQLLSTGVQGFPSAQYSGQIIGTSYGNHFYDTTLLTGAGASGTAIQLLGDETSGATAFASANTTFCVFENTRIALSDPGSGNTMVGIQFRFCDNITFTNLDIIGPGTMVGTCYDMQFDYTTVATTPMDCVIQNYSLRGSYGQVHVVGTPPTAAAGTGPNKMIGQRGGHAPIANATNLVVDGQNRQTLQTTFSSSPVSISTNFVKSQTFTGISAAITVNSTGTPQEGDELWVCLKDNGTARAITWGATFQASHGAALPTTTVASNFMTNHFRWAAAQGGWMLVFSS